MKNRTNGLKTIKRPSWYSQNSDMFPIKTTEKLQYLFRNPDLERKNDFDYQRHQKLIRDYMSAQTPYRGILLFHGLGSGKTCSSIAIAEGLKLRRKVIVLSPASLEKNYREELLKCGPKSYTERDIENIYTFIHYDGIRTDKLNELKRQNFFDNKTIIVDEVHNLVSMMSGSGKQGEIWYNIFCI